MNILVTGGAGFIGSHLCDELLKQKHRIVCVDNLLTGSLNNLSLAFGYKKKFEFIKENVCYYDKIKSIFKYYKIDVVYHCAAIVGVRRTLEDPFSVLKDIDGIKNILKLATEYKVKKFIYTSSSEVYGEPHKIPTSEETFINPRLIYGFVKLIGEKYCRTYFEKYKLKTCCLRLFNVYGPRQDCSIYGFVVARFIVQSLKNEDITIYGDGRATRDFTYVSDVINCLVKVLNLESTNGEIINVGTGVKTSIKKLAKIIINFTNSKSRIIYLPQRENDVLNRCADIKKMVDMIKYFPKYDLIDGLKKTIEWYKNLCD